MALNVKKGDTVLVIAGKDKGKSGKVLTAIPSSNAVIVSGVNITSKHKKPRNAQDKGGIMKAENKIDASNVQIICPTCGKATRIAHTTEGTKKVRTCKKCGANLDKTVKKAKAEKEVKEVKAEPKKTTAKTTKSTATKKTTTTKSATTKKTATKTAAKKSTAKEQ